MIPDGIHANLPESEYRKDGAFSYSSVKQAQPTMANYKAWMDDPDKSISTSYMDIGTLIGRMVLEPNRPAMDGFAIKPRPRAPNGWEDEQRSKGFMVLSESDVENANGCAKALRNHPTAGPILIGAGSVSEVTLVSTEKVDLGDGLEVTVRIKARVDCVPFACDYLADLKKVQDCSPGQWRDGKDEPYWVQSPFARVVGDRDYHMQAGLYLYLWNKLVPEDPRTKWVNVCVEEKPPHLVKCFQLADAAIDRGLNKFWRLLKGILRCEISGKWPGYNEEIEVIDLEKYRQ